MSPQTEGASNIGQVMRSLAGTHQRGGIASSRLGTVFADSLSYFALRAKLEKRRSGRCLDPQNCQSVQLLRCSPRRWREEAKFA